MSAASPHALLLPMAVLALWTMHVLLLVPIARIKAGRAGQVKPEDFRFGESERVPDLVRAPNRNFMNLLEVPVLWYVAGFIAMAIGLHHPVWLGLSWLFVALRIAHTLVHLRTGHSVLLRAGVFALGNVVVSVMWWWLLVVLITG
jgi:hypothetical protein